LKPSATQRGRMKLKSAVDISALCHVDCMTRINHTWTSFAFSKSLVWALLVLLPSSKGRKNLRRYFHHLQKTNKICHPTTHCYGKDRLFVRIICVLCLNFWTNYDLDLFSTSKWPSELQFCERYLCIWRKIG
jgi:hypothetical protein